MTVDRLGEVAVEEGVLDVQLMSGPGPASGDAEDRPDRGRFDHGTERLGLVDTGLLC